MNLRHAMLAVLVVASVGIAAPIDIPVLPEGDGLFHDEINTANDGFFSNANPNSIRYAYYGTGDSVIRDTSYAQFNLSSLGGLTQQSVMLKIRLTSAAKEDSTVSCGAIYHVADSSTATGNASQRLNGNELVGSIMPTLLTDSWHEFDVTDYINNDIAQGYSYAAFSFNPDTTGSNWYKDASFSFSSAEAGYPAYLQAVVPEPVNLSVVAFAAGALLRRRRIV